MKLLHCFSILALTCCLAIDALAQEGLNVDATGDVGIGTTTPLAPLHIARGSGNAQLLVDNINQATTEPRSMFELINNGPVGFNMEDVDTGRHWRFAAQTSGFRISLAGTGGPELEVQNDGDAVLAGTLMENSDVNAKQDIVPVAGESVLEKLEALPIAEWSYKDGAGTRHVGPMAQDFQAAFGLGHDDKHISARDMAGVNMAAVKAQQQHISKQQRRIAEMESRLAGKDVEIAALTARLEALGAQHRKVKDDLAQKLEQLEAQMAGIRAPQPQWVASKGARQSNQ